MSLVGVKVGDTVRVLGDRSDTPALVVKVGRSLVSLSDGHQYEMDSGARKGKVHGWGYTAYTGEALNRRQMEADLRGLVSKLYEATRRGPDSFKAVGNADLVTMQAQVETLYQKLCG